jgi:hypothetical protein
MPDATLPYIVGPNGTNTDATKVAGDLDALRDFINNSVVHRDASRSFTGLPELPTSTPATNQPVRKGLMDTALATKVESPTGAIVKYGSASVTLDGTGAGAVLFGAAFPGACSVVITQPTSASAAVRVTAKIAVHTRRCREYLGFLRLGCLRRLRDIHAQGMESDTPDALIGIKSLTVEAVIIRANGDREDLGVIASYAAPTGEE